MQRSIALMVLTALSLTSALGCSDDSAEPGGDGALLTTEEYCRGSAEQTCSVLAPCCSGAMEVCVERYRMSCSESAANASQKGQRFDADAAQQCIDSIPGAYEGCSPRPPEHPQVVLGLGSCSRTFSATLEPGAMCSFDGACLASSERAGICSDDGKCLQVPLLALGAACGLRASGVCRSDAYCDGSCKERLATGETCNSAQQCASRWCENTRCVLTPMEALCSWLDEEP